MGPLFISMKLLTLPELYKLNCILFIQFRERLFRGTDIHDHNTRFSSYLRLPDDTLKRVCQSFFFRGIEHWNKLSSDLVVFKQNLIFKINLTTFKKVIKMKLISKEIKL